MTDTPNVSAATDATLAALRVIALKELYPDLDRRRIRTIVTEYAEALERPDITENLERWFA